MRILLLQTSFLGDVVLSTPVIAALHDRYPGCEVWMMTTPQAKELVERDPLLAGVLPFDKNGAERSLRSLLNKARELKVYQFDTAFALQRSARTSLLLRLAGIPERIGFEKAALSFLYTERRPRDKARHDVLRNLQILDGAVPEGEKPELRIFPPSDEEVNPALAAELRSASDAVVLVPGSVWPTKRWDWRGYRAVARRFLELGRKVILAGGPHERQIAERVAGNLPVMNLVGRTTIAELAWLIGKAKLVICNDSLSLHLASALKIPAVGIFCATSPAFGFGPWQDRAKVVELDSLSCKPCSRHGSARCPTGTWACMRDLSPDAVLRAAEGLL